LADLALVNPEDRTAPSAADVRDLSRALGESPALAAWRAAGLAAYRDAAWPDRVQHLWRFTDPADLLPVALPAPLAAPAAVDLPADGPAVLLLPGRAPLWNAAAEAAGLALTPLADADPGELPLGAAVPPGSGLFAALNAAAWSAGLCLRVPRGRRLEAPLRVIVPAGAAASLPRLLVLVETGAEATVVEDHLGGGAGTRVVGVSELFLAPGARLRHVLVQRWAPDAAGHLILRGRLERDADLFSVLAAFGGRRVKLDVGAVLTGAGARSELVGVTLGEGRQHLDHHTVHRHEAGRTWSNLDFKAAVAGRARSTYTGLIRIEEGAAGSEAYQENRNLLLSPRAHADTIPELEILTDEVSCSHGATVAPVDPEHLFYLQSRGLTAPDALRLVVRGFLEDTLRRVPDNLRPALEELAGGRLARLTGGEAK
jgi:Fe-S cluster assembly protein SufD